MRVCMYVCMHARMYVCMYVFAHTPGPRGPPPMGMGPRADCLIAKVDSPG